MFRGAAVSNEFLAQSPPGNVAELEKYVRLSHAGKSFQGTWHILIPLSDYLAAWQLLPIVSPCVFANDRSTVSPTVSPTLRETRG